MRWTWAGRFERAGALNGAGTLNDGLTAARHAVMLRLSPDRQAIEITGDTLPAPLRWMLADLRALPGPVGAPHLVLTRHAATDDEAPRDPARLTVDDPDLVDWLRRSRPALFQTDLHPGTRRRLVRAALMAVAAIAVLLLVILPGLANMLARLIPLKTEIAFGESVIAQMERAVGAASLGALRCDAPAGRAALDRMVARLSDGRDLGYDLKVHVFDHPMINAFAAPGGQVVIMRGLLDQAPDGVLGADAVAGVLAHEFGHVANRDATRNALRVAGTAGILSMVVGDVAGSAVLVAVAQQMLDSSYTRDAETKADVFALDMLAGANIDADGFAAFFDRLAQEEGRLELPEYFSSHPATDGRAQAARNFAEGQAVTSPVLSEADWTDLKSICAKP